MNSKILDITLSVGVAAAMAALGYFGLRAFGQAAQDGALSGWDRITDPPETPARILVAGFGYLCMESVSGGVYCWSEPRGQRGSSNEWVERRSADFVGVVPDAVPTNPCSFTVASPPFTVIERVDDSVCFEFTYAQDSYAISDTFEIWHWSHYSTFGSAIFWGLCPIVASPVGALAAGVVGFRYLRRYRSSGGSADAENG